MKKIKCGDDLTTISNHVQTTCKQGEETNMHLDDTFGEELDGLPHLDESICCQLSEGLASKLSRRVVSLASFDGTEMNNECTGIVIKSNERVAQFLTSAELLRSNDGSGMFREFEIKVCLPDKQVVEGLAHRHDEEYNFIVVVAFFVVPCPEPACLDRNVQVLPHTELLAVRRCFYSNELMATRGLPVDISSGFHSKKLMSSKCKMTKVAAGGLLVDFVGNIIGMNMRAEDMAFLHCNLIIERLELLGVLEPASMRYCISRIVNNKEVYCTREKTQGIQKSCTPEGSSSGGSSSESSEIAEKFDALSISEKHVGLLVALEPTVEFKHFRSLRPWPSIGEFVDDVNEMLRSRGYPLPIYLDDDMECMGTFEEEFGEDIWCEQTKNVASKICESVVSLASFKGERRFFACTGLFIDCSNSTKILTSASLVRTDNDEDMIDHNLEIQVRLPSKEQVIGTLEHYDLTYNVAVLCVEGLCGAQAAKLDTFDGAQKEVVALGHGFESGELMATNGVLTNKRSKLDCKELRLSTCKITKAGIGGPLVDFCGNFVGMNFYDVEETPYLPRDIILKLLKHFNEKRTVPFGIMNKRHYSWVVPKAYWYYPTLHRAVPVDIEMEEAELL